MKNSFEKLEHYHDTGKHAISRGFETYKSMVFKDDDNSWLREKPESMTPDNPEQWSMRHFHTLEHFIPEQVDNKLSSRKDQQVQFEWDWKEEKIFGGLNSFFSNDSLVLDLGSGRGIATQEINEQYKDKNVKCIGVDYRYSQEPPHDAKNLVAGDFENLPFKDNAFNRILSVESFPCWLPSEEQAIDRYISEITRVSQIGTIWRGTLPTYEMEDAIKFPTDTLIRKFVESGWEVVVSAQSFSAKLVVKKEFAAK